MSMVRFIPVGQIVDPLTVTLGLSGASGTGKTYTALRVARGMAEALTGKPAPRPAPISGAPYATPGEFRDELAAIARGLAWLCGAVGRAAPGNNR